jgi:hypothetical protein
MKRGSTHLRRRLLTALLAVAVVSGCGLMGCATAQEQQAEGTEPRRHTIRDILEGTKGSPRAASDAVQDGIPARPVAAPSRPRIARTYCCLTTAGDKGESCKAIEGTAAAINDCFEAGRGVLDCEGASSCSAGGGTCMCL